MTSTEEKPTVVISEPDKEFIELIKQTGGPNIQSCYQCGTCSGSCPAGARTNYLVRGIIRKALMGLKEEVISAPELWYCTTCYTCTDRCPQDVKPTDVIKAIRNIAVQEGYMLTPHQKVAVKVLETGHAVPLDKESWQKLREKVGLEPIPPNASSHPEAIEEIMKMAKKSGFDKLVEDKEE
ncbi:MAG: CoB--CoM heterodisulfide reductase subunit C [Candidatus Lokiarchaeota archaeon]|nr:CoB--CoM heterodisulfide reductase subunit C [Candidatus Lokiarchaeota archaeon]